MKYKILLISILSVLLFSCGSDNNKKIVDGYEIVVIDSCEYIKNNEYIAMRNISFISHKGNCRFCEDRKKD